MTNGPKDDILHHHFSADEFYLMPILLTASVIHMLILFMSLWSAIVLKARHLFHATYKLYLMLIFFHVSIIFIFSNGGQISKNHLLIFFGWLWSAIVLKDIHLFYATYQIYCMQIIFHCSNSKHQNGLVAIPTYDLVQLCRL